MTLDVHRDPPELGDIRGVLDSAEPGNQVQRHFLPGGRTAAGYDLVVGARRAQVALKTQSNLRVMKPEQVSKRPVGSRLAIVQHAGLRQQDCARARGQNR